MTVGNRKNKYTRLSDRISDGNGAEGFEGEGDTPRRENGGPRRSIALIVPERL